MNRIKFFLLFVLLGLVSISLGLFFQESPIGFRTSPGTGSLPSQVDMQLSDVNYTEVAAGKQDWTLEAKTLRSFKTSKLMVFDDVRITFNTDGGLVLVTGRQARYDKKEKNIKVIGNVRVLDHKGYLLTVQELGYDVKQARLYTDEFFQIRGPRYDLDGYGLRVDMKDSRMTVLRNPRVLVKSTKKKM
ncbi:MAG: LPS export ABC transporter periplasmic protein LptC [Proteobacteria bacterium]|nr:LPS export ABC transporter periplasmic protein LptC [Pseudomonadota bacterium]